MKLILIFIMLPILSSCSLKELPIEEQTTETEKAEIKESINNDLIEEKTEMINELPQSAKVKDWNLILVNPELSLPENFEVDLVEVDNEQKIDKRIVEAWTDWKKEAEKAGHQLFLASAYRDIKRQKNNFNAEVKQYRNEGMSENEAIEKAKEYLTEPGHSEHHTGLALDIVDDEWIVSGRRLEKAYEETASQKWMMETKADFGFILRYPEGKEDITKIEYEPWHFRYVGPENARFIEKNELSLEEYIDLIEEAEN